MYAHFFLENLIDQWTINGQLVDLHIYMGKGECVPILWSFWNHLWLNGHAIMVVYNPLKGGYQLGISFQNCFGWPWPLNKGNYTFTHQNKKRVPIFFGKFDWPMDHEWPIGGFTHLHGKRRVCPYFMKFLKPSMAKGQAILLVYNTLNSGYQEGISFYNRFAWPWPMNKANYTFTHQNKKCVPIFLKKIIDLWTNNDQLVDLHK